MPRSRLGTEPYSFGFTAASLRPELLLIMVEAFFKAGSWEATKAMVLEQNALQCRSASSCQRMERELRPRLQTLSQRQLELFVSSGGDTRICLAWLAAVRHSGFLFEFASELLRPKHEDHDAVLRESDYRRFIESKVASHPELSQLSPMTSGKVRRVLFAMLREVGILKPGEAIGSLHRPVVPQEVLDTLRGDDAPDLAAFLVPDEEINLLATTA
jgi:hypothetical protein